MAYDNYLYERIANALRKRNTSFEEKRMFGGVAFMVDAKVLPLNLIPGQKPVKRKNPSPCQI